MEDFKGKPGERTEMRGHRDMRGMHQGMKPEMRGEKDREYRGEFRGEKMHKMRGEKINQEIQIKEEKVIEEKENIPDLEMYDLTMEDFIKYINYRS